MRARFRSSAALNAAFFKGSRATPPATPTNASSSSTTHGRTHHHQPEFHDDRERTPTKHQLAVMIWLAVLPTLTVLNLALGGWLHTVGPVVRTFVLVTIAVPIVSYAAMPQLHRLRAFLLTRLASSP